MTDVTRMKRLRNLEAKIKKKISITLYKPSLLEYILVAVESGYEAELKGVSSGTEVSMLGNLAQWISFLSICLF